jgi:hypothetical protein
VCNEPARSEYLTTWQPAGAWLLCTPMCLLASRAVGAWQACSQMFMFVGCLIRKCIDQRKVNQGIGPVAEPSASCVESAASSSSRSPSGALVVYGDGSPFVTSEMLASPSLHVHPHNSQDVTVSSAPHALHVPTMCTVCRQPTCASSAVQHTHHPTAPNCPFTHACGTQPPSPNPSPSRRQGLHSKPHPRCTHLGKLTSSTPLCARNLLAPRSASAGAASSGRRFPRPLLV